MQHTTPDPSPSSSPLVLVDLDADTGVAIVTLNRPEARNAMNAALLAQLDAASESSATWLRADLAREIAARLPAGAARGANQVVELVDVLADEAARRVAAVGVQGPPTAKHRPSLTARRMGPPWTPRDSIAGASTTAPQ